MKIDKTRALYAIIGSGLVAVLGVLFMQTRAVDFEAHNEIIGTMRSLKQVDAEWNVDVLRSKTGLAGNYDMVASPLPLVSALESALTEKAGNFWQSRTDSADRMAPLLANYRTLMDRKIAMIERFKSQNSILRNSSRFLPVAATDLNDAVRAGAVTPRAEVRHRANAERPARRHDDLFAVARRGAARAHRRTHAAPGATNRRASARRS